MDNNYNNNTNKQEGYNPYGSSQNSGFGNNNKFNQQYGTQDNSTQVHQNNNIPDKDAYGDQYSNNFYNQEQYNQQYNNTYGQNGINNDSTYGGQSQYNNNTYSQNNYNTQYDSGMYNEQQYNSQVNYQYNNGVTSNSPGYGYSIGSMVCGICGLISCWCYGFPGVILGVVALILYFKSKKMDRGVSNAMAKAGMVCGIISLILGVIYVAYVVFAFVVLGITMSDPSFYSDFYSTAFLK